MKNFAVTAMGRSGTRFLAENFNKSERWTVKHEAGNWKDMRRPVKDLQRRFNRDYYGEVNGYLRFIIDKLNVEKKGIILRDPAELWVSIATWHSQDKWKRNLRQKWRDDFNQVMKAIPFLLKLAETGRYFVIEFDRMTTDRDYLKEIFRHFGITDVRVTKKMLEEKINSSPEVLRRRTMDEFSPQIRSAILRLSDNYKKRAARLFGHEIEGV